MSKYLVFFFGSVLEFSDGKEAIKHAKMTQLGRKMVVYKVEKTLILDPLEKTK